MQWQRKHFMKVTEEKLHAITLYDYLKDRCLLESTNLKLHLGKFVSQVCERYKSGEYDFSSHGA